MVFWARVSFGIKNYVYIGLRVAFRRDTEDSLDIAKTLLFELTRVVTFYP